MERWRKLCVCSFKSSALTKQLSAQRGVGHDLDAVIEPDVALPMCHIQEQHSKFSHRYGSENSHCFSRF